MPELVAQYSDDDMRKRAPRTSQKDLSVQTGQIQQILDNRNVGGGLLLTPEELAQSRAVKRGYTTAAKQLGYNLKWRAPENAPNGGQVLKFVLFREGETPPGARQRRSKGEAEEETGRRRGSS